MTTHIVLYHGNCWDGFAAATIARRALGRGAEYHPVSYGNPIPYIPERSTVYILDFSYDAETLTTLAQDKECHVIVLDHHKTAKEALAGLLTFPIDRLDITFDMDESGATLAWHHFFPDTPMPALVRYVKDRDLWQWKLYKSKEISMALASYPFDFPTWDVMLDMPDTEYINGMIFEGAACLRLQQQMVQRMCAHAQLRPIGGFMVRVANATCFYSEVGEQLCLDYPDMPFAAYYSQRRDGKWQYGLRSRNGFDVSRIAAQYGGGGHAAAAGFISDTLL